MKCFVTIASEGGTVDLNSPSCLFERGECLKKPFTGCFHFSSVGQSLLYVMVAMAYFLRRSRRIQGGLKFSGRNKYDVAGWFFSGLLSFSKDLGCFLYLFLYPLLILLIM